MKEKETREVALTEFQISDVKIREARTDAKEYEKMKLDIQRRGIHTPVLLRTLEDGTLELIDGTQRATIAKEHGLKTIPARIFVNVSDLEARVLQMSANRNRIPQRKKEESDHIKIILTENPDMKQKELAEWLGMSENEISNILGLQNLVPEAHEAVNTGEIPGVKAVALSKLHQDDQLMCLKKGEDGSRKITLATDEFLAFAEDIRKQRKKGKKPEPKEFVFKARNNVELSAKCEELQHLVETTSPEDENYAIFTIQRDIMRWVGAIDEDSIREREEKRKKKVTASSLESLERQQEAGLKKLKEVEEQIAARKKELSKLKDVVGV